MVSNMTFGICKAVFERPGQWPQGGAVSDFTFVFYIWKKLDSNLFPLWIAHLRAWNLIAQHDVSFLPIKLYKKKKKKPREHSQSGDFH